jgi:hypothetical protein
MSDLELCRKQHSETALWGTSDMMWAWRFRAGAAIVQQNINAWTRRHALPNHSPALNTSSQLLDVYHRMSVVRTLREFTRRHLSINGPLHRLRNCAWRWQDVMTRYLHVYL